MIQYQTEDEDTREMINENIMTIKIVYTLLPILCNEF